MPTTGNAATSELTVRADEIRIADSDLSVSPLTRTRGSVGSACRPNRFPWVKGEPKSVLFPEAAGGEVGPYPTGHG